MLSSTAKKISPDALVAAEFHADASEPSVLSGKIHSTSFGLLAFNFH
jgi:hypothetical protein